ncbi:MAG: type I restriction endonuclease subunit R [Chloroflexota bacterium]|nr:type I restriction endonuclease subunit R [Chloroflexota bacterium]
MSNVGQLERKTQNRVVKLFQEDLGYDYLGNWESRKGNSNIEEEYLRAFLAKQGYADEVITRALYKLDQAAGDQSKSLYDVNKAVYSLLRYGVRVRPDVGENVQTVKLINWEEPLSNHFAVAEEVTITGVNTKRPDVVLYVNGIALGVLELKRSIVSVSEGIRQNLDNQKKDFIQPFFATMQLVMAGNDTQGLRYGVIETPEKYYLTWKESNTVKTQDFASLLDRHLTQLCNKERLLEIIHDFIVFDAGTKKICRHSQYFGVKASQKRVRQREGGIIWHAQGSGKSLVMVWLTKWMREHVPDARVLIITDRTELDDQIEKVFLGVNEEIYRTTSGQDLVSKLNATTPWLMCSLIHKFGNQADAGRDVEGYITEVRRSLPPDFHAQGDIYVYVDECHRTQSGKLHAAMKEILPNAMFIGFTGTPLLKDDKESSLEVFGSYIHTYKFDEAVRDEVILDLRYEARDVEQTIASQKKIDQWFEAKTKGLNNVALAQLKQRWGTMKRVLSSKSRLEQIVSEIMLDIELKDRLKSGRGNAMLISGSIYQACRYYELFVASGLEKCAIVTSYKPSIYDIKGEETGEGMTEKLRQYSIYRQMLADYFNQPEDQVMSRVERFEREVKKKFVDEPGQMKLLIVVDKLLTGFDAPPATYLYIDKPMRDHGLFQAICRVNRLDSEDKEYGYIIDYRDLFKSLEKSIHDYTSEALDGYDEEDVAGLLTDRLEKGRERLEDARETIKALCEPVEPPKDTPDYLRYFCTQDTTDKDALKDNEPKRIALYKYTASLVRAYANLANEMPEADYSPEEIAQVKQEVKHYEKVRGEVKLSSGDYIDLKSYEPAMRHLLDSYIRAEDSETISAFDDMSLIQLVVERGEAAVNELPEGIRNNPEAVAETIENNVRRVIIDENPINPKYYERMSTLLDTLIQQRKNDALEYKQYLAKVVELTRQVHNPAASGAAYPESLDTSARRALYDNLDNDEVLALALDDAIRQTKKDGWRGNKIKEREVKYAIHQHVDDEAEVERVFELVTNQREY